MVKIFFMLDFLMGKTICLGAAKCFRVLIVFFLSCFLTACATLPDVKSMIQELPHREPAPAIFGAHGELSFEKRKAIIHQIEKQAGSKDLLKRQIPLMESISDPPLVDGNKATLLLNDPATYSAMFSAIQGAGNHVNFETFIFDDDENGSRFANLLIQKSKEGVQVNLIYDSVGCHTIPASFFRHLQEGGVRVLEYNPIEASDISGAINRDHRKILIVDGKIAFTGGVNIGQVYSESLYGRHNGKDGALSWRDTDIRIEGPVVAEFQRIFLETWEEQEGREITGGDYFPPLKKAGDELVRVVGSTPGKENRITYMMYVAAMTFAEDSIHLTNAYFVPDEEMIRTITGAAGRGVDVKIILPATSDSALVFSATRSYYTRLLKAGVKLYERRGAILHAKTGVIDGVWSTVGSTNLDLWSFLRNNEVNAVILGKDFADQMEDMFQQDLADSDQVLLERWERRSLVERLKEWFAHLFAYWL